MAAVNRQFGTDLKFQREHLQLFAANLQRISENPKCFIQDKDWVNSNDNTEQLDFIQDNVVDEEKVSRYLINMLIGRRIILIVMK